MHRENDAQAIERGAEQLGKAKASRDKPSACTDEPDLLHLQAPMQTGDSVHRRASKRTRDNARR